MGDCIAITNQKGGVGKSSTVNALGAGLTRRGYKVLSVDLDAQSNLTYISGVVSGGASSLDILQGRVRAEDAVTQTNQGDLIPASPALSSADNLFTETGKEYRLREALEPLKSNYDYILLDTPPALGVITINALTACNHIMIPALAEVLSLQGIGQLSQTINAVHRYCNQLLEISGILITRYKSRALLSKKVTDLLEETAAQLNTTVYKTKIRECVALGEAQAAQKDIFSYSPKSNAAADYSALIDEILVCSEVKQTQI